MPHKCVKCGKVYGNLAPELMKGCTCKSRIFLFLREGQVSVKEKMELLERESRALAQNEQVQEIAELMPISIEKIEEVKPKTMEAETREREAKEMLAGGEGRGGGPVAVDELEAGEKESGEAREEEKEEAKVKVKGKEELDFIKEVAGGELTKAKLITEEGEEPIENVTVLEKGRYRLDIKSLMAGNPLVIRTEKGVFYIRIPSPIEQKKKV